MLEGERTHLMYLGVLQVGGRAAVDEETGDRRNGSGIELIATTCATHRYVHITVPCNEHDWVIRFSLAFSRFCRTSALIFMLAFVSPPVPHVWPTRAYFVNSLPNLSRNPLAVEI